VRLRAPRVEAAAAFAVIAGGPALCVVALRLPLINQLDYADAWFYSAYAWAPKHHFSVLGWTYFSVRFPAILSVGLFERVFDTHSGYVVLRYLLAVASGGAIFLCVRRFGGLLPALAACVLLYLDPFFSRMLLWDYSGFFSVAAGVAGFALWWWSEGRSVWWAAVAGAALAAAVFANPVVGTAVLVLLVVETVAAVRIGRRATINYAYRLAISAVSSAVVFFAGYVSYRMIVPSTRVDDLVRPTIDYLRSNKQNSAPYQRPASGFLLHEVRIWAPVVLSLALIALLGRRVLKADVPARIAQVCIAYTAFLWLYRFTVTSSVIETWWAYDVVVFATAPATGVLVYELGRRIRSQPLSAAVAVATSAVFSLVIRDATGTAAKAYRHIADSTTVLYAIVGLAAAAALVLAVRSRWIRLGGAVVLFAALTVMLWAPSVFDGRGTTGVFVTDGGTEWRAYPAARQFLQIVRDYDAPRSRVYTWYSGTLGLTNIAWTTLPQTGQTVQPLGVSEPLDHLDALGRARLLQPDAAYVLVLTTRSAELRSARHALVGGGFGDRAVRSSVLGSSGLRYELLRLTKKP
jgi:hypothetical protein